MNKKWEYKKPYIEVVFLAEEDLVRTSLTDGGTGMGGTGGIRTIDDTWSDWVPNVTTDEE